MAYPSLFDLLAVAMYLVTPSLLALICILNNGVCFSRLNPCAILARPLWTASWTFHRLVGTLD